MIDLITDFDKDDEKRKLFNVLKSLKGLNVIQIKKFRKKRSTNQNAYLFGVVYRYLGEEIGYTTDECHQLMKRRFLSYEKSGEVFVKSTTDLDTMDMEGYIAQIKSFALEQFSVLIPDPNEVNF